MDLSNPTVPAQLPVGSLIPGREPTNSQACFWTCLCKACTCVWNQIQLNTSYVFTQSLYSGLFCLLKTVLVYLAINYPFKSQLSCDPNMELLPFVIVQHSEKSSLMVVIRDRCLVEYKTEHYLVVFRILLCYFCSKSNNSSMSSANSWRSLTAIFNCFV